MREALKSSGKFPTSWIWIRSLFMNKGGKKPLHLTSKWYYFCRTNDKLNNSLKSHDALICVLSTRVFYVEPSSSHGHLRYKRDSGQSYEPGNNPFLGSKLARNHVGNKISKFSPVKCNWLVGAQCNTLRNTATSIWFKPKRVWRFLWTEQKGPD